MTAHLVARAMSAQAPVEQQLNPYHPNQRMKVPMHVLAIGAWTCVVSGLLFFVLNATGMLRVPSEVEEKGMDESKHGGMAYHDAK